MFDSSSYFENMSKCKSTSALLLQNVTTGYILTKAMTI